MDINPLSLLEVTMGSDPVENEDDDDCIILDPPIETHIIDDTPDPIATEPEPEIGPGYHFLQQADETLQDPLAMPTVRQKPSNSNNIPFCWVSTNIASLAVVSNAEYEFRKGHYKDVHNVLQDKLHCTICQDHVGCDIRVHSKAIEHPVLKVLTCEKCATHYRNLQFTLNDQGKETRCRWCGKSPMGGGAPLRRCHQCPFSFCQNCLSRNLPNQPKAGGPWLCCVCHMKYLWPARSLLWALQTLKERFLSRPCTTLNMTEDLSTCAAQCREIKMSKKGNWNKKKNQTAPVKEKPPLQIHQGYGQNAIPSQSNCTNIGFLNTHQPSTPSPSSFHPSLLNNHSFSNSSVVEVKNDLIKTTWFISKLESYENDVLNLARKIKKIRQNCVSEESPQNLNMKVETVTTLLSLNSSLFKDCSLNLMNEWKEKKSRHEIENINVNSSTSHHIQEVAPHSSGSTTALRDAIARHLTPQPPNNGPQNRNKSSVNRKTPTKSRKINNKSTNISLKLKNLLQQHGIKNCYVRLEKLPKTRFLNLLNNDLNGEVIHLLED